MAFQEYVFILGSKQTGGHALALWRSETLLKSALLWSQNVFSIKCAWRLLAWYCSAEIRKNRKMLNINLYTIHLHKPTPSALIIDLGHLSFYLDWYGWYCCMRYIGYPKILIWTHTRPQTTQTERIMFKSLTFSSGFHLELSACGVSCCSS